MKLALLGDVALVGRYDMSSHPDAFERLNVLRDYLEGFDHVIANLESPLTSRTRSWIAKSMHLRSDPSNVRILKHLGVDAVSLANNHVNDFGRAGLDETIRALEAESIEWYGVDGRSIVLADGPDRISLSGFCCLSANGTGYSRNGGLGVNVLTRERLERQLSKDRSADALTVFSLHWGREHTHFPNPEHLSLMRSLAQENTFLGHGHHPHVIQGIEDLGDSVVAYSLGNCLFDDVRSMNGRWHLRQTQDNRVSFVMAAEICGSSIVSCEPVGFEDTNDGIVFRDITDSILDYTKGIVAAGDAQNYEKKREDEVASARAEKFGARDVSWLLARMNYHSIGARFAAIPRRRAYKEVMADF